MDVLHEGELLQKKRFDAKLLYGSLSTTQSFLPVSIRTISENLRVMRDDPRGVTNTTGKV
jgi:hypothetical protein